MNTLRIKVSQNFLVFSLLFFVTSQAISAQTFPTKVKNYLDKRYSGWKLSAVTDGCGADFSKSKVSGDFNGDKKTDYAVKFLKGSKYYIVAFVSIGSNFKPIVLESGSAKEAKYQGLSISHKGEMYGEIINEDFDRTNRRLQNDAPVGGTCESSAYLYIYKNGAFKRAFTSD
jgi:hypothetical protein